MAQALAQPRESQGKMEIPKNEIVSKGEYVRLKTGDSDAKLHNISELNGMMRITYFGSNDPKKTPVTREFMSYNRDMASFGFDPVRIPGANESFYPLNMAMLEIRVGMSAQELSALKKGEWCKVTYIKGGMGHFAFGKYDGIDPSGQYMDFREEISSSEKGSTFKAVQIQMSGITFIRHEGMAKPLSD